MSLLSSGIQQQSTVPENILSKLISMDGANVYSALFIAFLRIACRCVLSFEQMHKILTKITRMYDRSLPSNIKIEILNCLCAMSKFNLSGDDKNSDDCFRMISSLIGKLYRDDDVMVSEECVILLLTSNEVRLKSEIDDLVKCESKSGNTTCDPSKWSLARKVQYEHKCDITIVADTSNAVRRNDKDRLTLGFDFEIDDATELMINLQRSTNEIVELHRASGLSDDNIQSIGKIVNTLSNIK